MYNNKCSRYQIEVTRPKQPKWGFSSAGRAPALHAGGQEFESPNLHHLKQMELFKSEPSGSFLMLAIYAPCEQIMFCVIRHLKLKCLTHKMINFKIERF